MSEGEGRGHEGNNSLDGNGDEHVEELKRLVLQLILNVHVTATCRLTRPAVY